METNDLILERMQRLLCLSLEGQPAAELIQGTARVWSEHLAGISQDRLCYAFDAVEKSAKRWPTIAHIRECLPAYQLPQPVRYEMRIERERDPKEVEAANERIRKLLQETQRRLGEKDEPEEAA